MPLLCYCRSSDDKDSFNWFAGLWGWMCQCGAGEHLGAATGFEAQHAVFSEWCVCLSKSFDCTDRTRFGDIWRWSGGWLHLLQIVAMRLLHDSFAILFGLVFSVTGLQATATVLLPSFELVWKRGIGKIG